MDRSRLATLVFVDGSGSVLGATDPIRVDQPWWQETGPVTDLEPGSAVLRLLSAEPDKNEPMGGRVTYLIQRLDGGEPLIELKPWDGTLTEDALRHPWARPGGPTDDLAWVRSAVPLDGLPRQHRTWNLSAIWSVPTPHGTVWLKCVPPFFAHEAAVLRLMADQSIPRLIAADGHRMLLAELPGEDGYHADEEQQRALVETLVDIQLASAHRIEALLSAGVPDLRAGPLQHELTELVARVAPSRPAVGALIDDMPRRLDAVAACGMPDTLVHGDPHGGNCRIGIDRPIWFDWGDAFVGNPLLDVAATHRMAPATVDHWLDLWAERVPGSRPGAAWAELQPIATLRMAWVYQRFLDNIETAERIYHHDDVDQMLDLVEQQLA